jgi:hypothetical protein
MTDEKRPRTRGDCKYGPRPCPWVSCRYHLVDLRVSARGHLGVGEHALGGNASPDEVDAFVEAVADIIVARVDTCALDVTDRAPDGATLQRIAEALDCTRERIRQIETKASPALRRAIAKRKLR